MAALQPEKSSRHVLADVALAGFVVMTLVIMIFKIPQPLADFLIAINIALAATVLFIALFVSNASRFSAMPTILILAMLFRLGLNVSTTKLILLDAEAGQIIRAFGKFVAGGNIVVGAVVFLILVLIQFIVIAKGAERVAEVEARFTLDAMPGEQMAIDGDLSRGISTEEETRLRRDKAKKATKIAGAMDGAMKFVKGDAIAGILISAVNIVGGLLIGVLDRKMAPAAALDTYGLLTIGDGLVSQIPALLLSVAAGLIVTKVAVGEEAERDRPGADMLAQLLRHPVAFLLTGAVMTLMALGGLLVKETGLPFIPFATLAMLCVGVGVWQLRRASHEARAQGVGIAAAGEPELEGEGGDAPGAAPALRASFEPAPFVLEIHAGLFEAFGLERVEVRADWRRRIADLRVRLSEELGFQVPSLSLKKTAQALPENCYAFFAFDGHLTTDQLRADRLLVLAPLVDLQAFEKREGIDLGLESAPLPGSRLVVASVPESSREACEAAGKTLRRADEVVFIHAEHLLRRYAAEFVTFQEVSRLIERLRDHHADLVQAVIPSLFPVQDVFEILKALLREQMTIRDLRAIFEALACLSLPPESRTPLLVVQAVRQHLRKALCSRYAVKGKRLDYYMFDPALEDMIRDHASGRPLAPDDVEELRRAVLRHVPAAAHAGRYAVLRVPAELRAATFALVGAAYPEIAVLSDQEFSPEIMAKFLGIIRGDEEFLRASA
ncbi:MAG: flagellar biosynthesis protein FlhA [Planctomycetota bacterium]